MSKEPRRLSAIVFADVVGYSRLIGQDEIGTLRRFKALREELIDPQITDHGGHIVKTAGDGLLVEFPSVVNAVQWAIEAQQAVADRNVEIPDEEMIRFRIGIHLGDVIVDGNDLLGDGVNIAARLEATAPIDGVAISGTVHDYLDEHTAALFEDVGAQNLKNIRRPICVWNWRQHRNENHKAVAKSASTPTTQVKPSIAILPFRALGRDPESELLADAICEEITTTLAQISSLLVISRVSSGRYKDAGLDSQDVASKLGVRYILQGSIQTAGERVRVTSELTDTEIGAEIWADRFSHTFDDIFELQDLLTKEIVTALRLTLTDGEQARVWLRSTNNVAAWRHAMRGADHIWQGTAASMVVACELLEKAVTEDPNYAAAFALKGLAHYFEVRFGYTGNPQQARRSMSACVERALALDPDEPYALLIQANQMSFEGRFDDAVGSIQQSIAKNPNDATVRLVAARILINADRPIEAEREIRMAIRVNPHYPVNYLAVLANSLVDQERYEEALDSLNALLERNSDYISAYLHLTYLYHLLDRPIDAKRQVREILRLDPDYNLGKAASFYISTNQARKTSFLDSLRAAGVPDNRSQ